MRRRSELVVWLSGFAALAAAGARVGQNPTEAGELMVEIVAAL